MGELIEVINKYNGMNIEINEPSYPGGQRNIHVQNKNFRFAVSEGDFLVMAVGLKKAVKVFKHNKEM